MKQIITFLLLLGSTYAFAQVDTITTDKAKNYVDKEVVVKGKVAGAKLTSKGILLINLDENYPNSPLTVVIYEDLNKNLGLDEEKVKLKSVVAHGKISVYQGRNQLVIDKQEDLKLSQ